VIDGEFRGLKEMLAANEPARLIQQFMRILRDPLNTITAPDIVQLCDDQAAEGTELELKQALPSRAGRQDPWHTGGAIGEYARNEIAEEIVAFANTLGGVVLIGIEETTDHPKRAARHATFAKNSRAGSPPASGRV
jgi:hypothetical protein